MFYIKTTINGELAEIEIYDDEIYTRCFNCGKEIQADNDTIRDVMKDGDLSSTSIACCNNEKPLKNSLNPKLDSVKLIRIK